MVQKYYIQIGIGLIIIVMIFASGVTSATDKYQIMTSEVVSELQTSETSTSEIYVQVTGAVNKPGMYKMKSGSRINDLLQVADGKSYNQQCINLAQKLVDEQNLYVPAKSEQCQLDSGINAMGIVNINTADVYELQTISGIGEAKANNIIEYRKQAGTFESKEQLLNVDGISEGLLQSITDKITLS